MTELERSPKSRFLTLDAMRGIAALFVLTRHFPDPTFVRLFPASYLAVDMFFVLSGFVLSHAYGWDLARKMGGPAFLLKRVIRLYPLYILGSAMSLVAYLAIWLTWHPWRSLPVLMTSIAGALCLLPLPPKASFNPFFAYPFNQPAWSLFWELAANFLFALLGWTVPRLLALAAAGAVLLVLVAWHFGNIGEGQSWDSFTVGGARVLFSFFAGALLYRFHARWHWRLAAPLLLLLLPLLFMLPVSWELPTALVLFPLLVFAGSMTEPSPGLERLFTLLGDISYPVYALHFSVMLLMTCLFHMATGQELAAAGVSGTIVGMAISTIAAFYAGSRFDPAARKWITAAMARMRRTAQGG